MFQWTEFRLFYFQVHLIWFQDGNTILSWLINFVIVLVVTLKLLYPLIDCVPLLIKVLKQGREEKEAYLPHYWRFSLSNLRLVL